MSESSSTTDNKKYWIYFGISFLATVGLLAFASEWFWVGLPFMLTYLVQAMNKM